MIAERETAKEKLLQVADREFYIHGINQTGINTLTDLAGVARMSLYKNFASKDAIIIEYLERRHQRWNTFHQQLVNNAESRIDRAMCIPQSAYDHGASYGDDFRGCGLANAASELQTNDDVRQRVIEIKDRVQNLFCEDLAAAGISTPDALAEELYFFLEGGLIHAGLRKDINRVTHINALIEKRLRKELGDEADLPLP